nr:hypothetical protein [Streptomyces silvensis]
MAVHGRNDPWSAERFTPSHRHAHRHSRRYAVPGATHGATIAEPPGLQRSRAAATIERRAEVR